MRPGAEGQWLRKRCRWPWVPTAVPAQLLRLREDGLSWVTPCACEDGLSWVKPWACEDGFVVGYAVGM